MLQFIVLGLIPGTHLQITFLWVLIATAALVLTILLFLELPRLYRFLVRPQTNADLEQTA